MRSEEFFNIFDDIDDRIVSEIYEDVQRPQRLAAVPRSPKRLPKLILSGAACAAVIAAAAVLVRFVLPGKTDPLTSSSDAVTPGDSDTQKQGWNDDWFAWPHTTPLREPDSHNHSGGGMTRFSSEHGNTYWSAYLPEDVEARAVDSGVVTFAGHISEEYGNAVIIEHYGKAYTAYGCLDPDSVTVSAGDSVMGGDVFAKPMLSDCEKPHTALQFMASETPISEQDIYKMCENGCDVSSTVKMYIGKITGDDTAPEDRHRACINIQNNITPLRRGIVVYAGTDIEGGNMVVVNHLDAFYVVYKGFSEEPSVKAGDYLGYSTPMGAAADSKAYWYALDPHKLDEFSKENGISAEWVRYSVDKPLWGYRSYDARGF